MQARGISWFGLCNGLEESALTLSDLPSKRGFLIRISAIVTSNSQVGREHTQNTW